MHWRRRKNDAPGTSDDHVEARKALHKAKKDLKSTEDRNAEIISVAEEVRRYGVRNSFTEMIDRALHGTGT